ncbi:MAG: hypothetical protein IMZ75_11120 [Actinobacteria bacterium]|nr:hypothetical protein [Actinomycetota bacterium]
MFDTGVGLSDHQIVAINGGEQSPLAATTAAADTDTDAEDRLAGTGLGLSIVRALAHARGGTLHAAHAPDGGAAMILTFPLNSPGEVGPFVPRVASDALPMQPALPT